MTAISHWADFPPGRMRISALPVLLVSVFVFAQTVEQNDLSVTIDERQKEEIYADAGDWRGPDMELEEDVWRKTERVEVAPKTRMQFGYDSVYDDARMRRDEPRTTLDLEIEKYKPDSAFKIRF